MWWSCPAPFNTNLIALHSTTSVFSLPHACLAAGLLKPAAGASLNRPALTKLTEKKWKKNVNLFLADAGRIGITEDSVHKAGENMSGACIGWDARLYVPGHDMIQGYCPDLNLVLAILSRRTGNIFFAARKPDFGGHTLFQDPFEVDEDLGPAPSLDQAPWSKFKWIRDDSNETGRKPRRH